MDMATADAIDGSTTRSRSQEMRGQYLVNSVLGCPGCHTPKAVDGGAWASRASTASPRTGGGCLSSANLTADATGIENLSDQQVNDAFTKGIYPEGADGGTHTSSRTCRTTSSRT